MKSVPEVFVSRFAQTLLCVQRFFLDGRTRLFVSSATARILAGPRYR